MAEVQVNHNHNNTAKECERDFGAAVTAKAQQLQRALRWAGFQSVSRIYHIVIWSLITMLMRAKNRGAEMSVSAGKNSNYIPYSLKI